MFFVLLVLFELFLFISISPANATLEARKDFDDSAIDCSDIFPVDFDFPEHHDVDQYGRNLTKLCAWEKSKNNVGCTCHGDDKRPTCEESKADPSLFFHVMDTQSITYRQFCMEYCWCKARKLEPEVRPFRMTRSRAGGIDSHNGLNWDYFGRQRSGLASSCHGQQGCLSRSKCRLKKHKAFYDPRSGLWEHEPVCIPIFPESGGL